MGSLKARLTMSWYVNDPKRGEKLNVKCNENYP
jgi:hypothetical protein